MRGTATVRTGFLAAEPDGEFPPLADYAVIGDGRTAALVSRSGSIEWLCFPSFSSASIFAAILDREIGGSFTISPPRPFTSTRRYLPGTPILETTFETPTGTARTLDFMSVGGGAKPWHLELRPQRELLRIVECVEGSVEIEACLEPRPDYGARAGRAEHRPGFGWVYRFAGAVLTVAADMTLAEEVGRARLIGRATLLAGESRTFGLGFDQHEIAVAPACGADARRELDATARWWRSWTAECTYDGADRETIVRSAITLKLMTYALSGAMVAAVTTSLPEAVGGQRNFDYRFCWLRDASITMRAFLGLGFRGEAEAFLGFLLNATRLTRPELRILYDLHGRHRARERTLDHLTGYRGSRPVRVGNAAFDQLQLDTYGAVIMAAFEFVEVVGPLPGGEMSLLGDFGEVVCRRWQEPDHGIWELRGETRHFTATKVLCWAALDRVVRLAERGLLRIPLERFRDNRDRLEAEIEERGFDPEQGAYTAEFDGAHGGAVDASVLLMGWAGFGDPARERLRSTFDRIVADLGRDGLLARFPTGYDGDLLGEGTFAACSAWAAILAARQGDLARARALLDRLARTANDVGLLAEEFDPDEGIALGNLPQAFVHAGLITATLELREAERRSRGR